MTDIRGTQGNDDIVGTAGSDMIVDLWGDDIIDGGDGDDVIIDGQRSHHIARFPFGAVHPDRRARKKQCCRRRSRQ
jgi:RTX calcium-binding nonapeptide repeat (4 copies)